MQLQRPQVSYRLTTQESTEDGAPRGINIPAPTEWQTVEVPLNMLRFFGHWTHSEGRGGEGDRRRSERLDRWTLAFGAWLNPTQAAGPHILQIVGIEPARRILVKEGNTPSSPPP